MSATIIRVKVKPNARTSALTRLPDGSWGGRRAAGEGKPPLPSNPAVTELDCG
jgi:hypothetical protein